MTEINNNKHIWNFARIGGNERVKIESGKDLENLEHLDQKLWTALSCPVDGLHFDKKTLEIMDGDSDGKIRAPEILSSVKWILSVLKNPDDLVKPKAAMPLSAINDSTPEGKQLLESSKQILINLKKADSSAISAEDTSDTIKIFADTKFNGDGIIVEDTTDDENLKLRIKNIIDCIGLVADRSGKPGITAEFTEKFYEACLEFSAWHEKAEKNFETVLPFSSETENALADFNAVKSKIEDYFIRCRFAEFDPRSTEMMNLQISNYETVALKDLSLSLDEIAAFPISQITVEKKLNFSKGLNPAWESALQKFKKSVIVPVFGEIENLNESNWNLLSEKFKEYVQWKSEKKGEIVEKLGLEQVREILEQNRKSEIIALIDYDKTFSDEADAIFSVDKMVRYYNNLFTLINNFVSFVDFYDPERLAIFQFGTLYIDQRSSDFCLKVVDAAKHGLMAHLSGMYLLYCDCTSKSRNEKMSIVAGITNGDVDNLMIGRNGIFYDRNGNDWDATVTKIIENPISLRQAFWSPYKKFARMIEEQIQKLAANREKNMEQSASANIEKTATKLAAEAPKTDDPKKDVKVEKTAAKTAGQVFDIGKYVGIFAAIGLAIGAIGTALASIISGFLSLAWWKMPLALGGIIMLISFPSMILAWMKLRKRNLSPILDANGWAVNAKAIINIPFGNTLTAIARLPKNSVTTLKDPFSKKGIPLWVYILIIAAIAGISYFMWYYGYWKMLGFNWK
jgi:hypothetical protein